MLLLGFLIIPVVFTAGKPPSMTGYSVEINDNNVLINVQATVQSVFTELDLSRRNLRGIEANAFQHVRNLTSLNLAHNSIVELPEKVFKRLRHLKFISLANNSIATFGSVFVGLRNLETVDLSFNPICGLDKNVFRGLEKCDFILTGSTENLWYFTNIGFYNLTETPKTTTPVLIDLEAKCRGVPTWASIEVENVPDDVTRSIDPSTKCPRLTNTGQYRILDSRKLDKSVRVEACIDDGALRRVSRMSGESPSTNCRTVPINFRYRSLDLTDLGIRSFDKYWYRLLSLPITTIDLSFNAVVNLTENVLNDLPESVEHVRLAGNRIEALEAGTIGNRYLKYLNLSGNGLGEIPTGAFDDTRLAGLVLSSNGFTDASFVANLPPGLTELYLNGNEITEVAANSFRKSGRLVHLDLGDNGIGKLGAESLRGLTSLQRLDLSDNGLRTFEVGAFGDLGELRSLELNRNDIVSLDSDVFAGPKSLLFLELSGNNFTRITRDTLKSVPRTVRELDLSSNGIESLEPGSFVNVPMYSLILSGNKITRIEPEYFDVPTLARLYFARNRLTELQEEMLDLPNLQFLEVFGNQIKTIERGAFRKLGKLTYLDISLNPFTRLEKGSMVGISRSLPAQIYMVHVALDVLRGSVFVDMGEDVGR